jgi:hypothetical protein
VVLTPRIVGGFMFYTSWTSQSKAILTEESLAFQAVWYIWSNGPDLKWTAVCATYDFRDLRSLLQTLQRQLCDDLFQIRATLNLIPRK